MQPQLDIISSNKQTAATQQQQQQQLFPTKATPSPPTVTINQQNHKEQHHHNHCQPKIIKGKKPLIHFKFYLDICDHQLTKTIEERINGLGGSLEFFLTSNITHFISDKTIYSNNKNKYDNKNTLKSNRSNDPPTPASPGTFYTPSPSERIKNGEGATTSHGSGTPTTTKRHSRADAMLNKVRRGSLTTGIQQDNNNVNCYWNNNKNYSAIQSSLQTTAQESQTYLIWTTEYALRFFKRITHDLKNYIDVGDGTKKLNGRSSYGSGEPINLKGGFIKIEAIKRSQRPYYQLFRKPAEWPKIELNRDDGAFRLSPKRKPEIEREIRYDKPTKMTRKSRSRSSQCPRNDSAKEETLSKQVLRKSCDGAVPKSVKHAAPLQAGGGGCKQAKESSEKQCGVCEICKIEYDTLTIHLKTKDHEYFARNSQNFIALDTLIHTSADVNTFLGANRTLENSVKSELEEEMEEVVDEMTSIETDPLGNDHHHHHEPTTNQTKQIPDKKKRRSNASYKTPSPTLREKSKRSTKGKHSSEKFQNISFTKSPRSASSVSPRKRLTAERKIVINNTTSSNTIATTSFISNTSTTIPTTANCTLAAPIIRRRTKAAIAAVDISPPIRAMLPPSSLYKVVETTTQSPKASNTSPRKTRNVPDTVAAATASPSLIVKFKKVRQAELLRLHGEAENFMFPRRRPSSDLPTDNDRQTTSENALQTSISSYSAISSSLDSSSEHLMDSLVSKSKTQRRSLAVKAPVAKSSAKTTQSAQKSPQKSPHQPASVECVKRPIGRPRKTQSFPNAPIQPEDVKPLRSFGSDATYNAPPLVAAAANISLPEATRKSSRTATAIVTAATKSSRLLRAAVKAAKNSKRFGSDYCQPSKCVARSSKAVSTYGARTRSNVSGRNRRPVVVKLEDRMGDEYEERDTDDTNNNTVYECKKEALLCYKDNNDGDDGDSDDGEEEEQDDDDERDADYVSNIRRKYSTKTKRQKNAPKRVGGEERQRVRGGSNSNSRNQRGAPRKRQPKVNIKQELVSAEEEEEGEDDGEVDKLGTNSKSKACGYNRLIWPTAASQNTFLPNSTHLDVNQTEDVSKLEYTFERIPTADPWYSVFRRQDTCEENIFEYYGSTNYRKLPYELGPIPFDYTLDGIDCKLCEHSVAAEKAPVQDSLSKVNVGTTEIELTLCENQQQSYPSATMDDNKPTTSAGAKATAKATVPLPSSPAPSTNKASSSKYTHKKLHLLQRYRREQQELLQKQQQQEAEQQETLQPQHGIIMDTTTNLAESHARNDSNASTPEPIAAHTKRAGSTQSNVSSSCASSSDTMSLSRKIPHNKHLNKAAFLSLELPPRKSPREHASTLALVSCLIKQRQDSQSKPNSETDDESPTTPPVDDAVDRKDDIIKIKSEISSLPELTTMTATTLSNVPLSTAPSTPIEEVLFTTEISENVKRMRRGQNKYDHSSTIRDIAHSLSGFARGTSLRNNKSVAATTRTITTMPTTLTTATTTIQTMQHSASSSSMATTTPIISNQTKRLIKQPSKYNNSYCGTNNNTRQSTKIPPSIRKTGSKKGVLEFEVDTAALNALQADKRRKTVLELEWEIDKYLQQAGQDYGDVCVGVCEPDDALKDCNTTSITNIEPPINTPPTTDYFSSDFDLFDLVASAQQNKLTKLKVTQTTATHNERPSSQSFKNNFDLFSFGGKRKNLKSNRTGWPKIQKRKKLTDRICFMSALDIKQEQNTDQQDEEGVDDDDMDDESRDSRQQSCVITPPETDDFDDEEDVDVKAEKELEEEGEDATSVEDSDIEANGSIADSEVAEKVKDDVSIDMDDNGDDIAADVSTGRTRGTAITNNNNNSNNEIYYETKTKRKRRCCTHSNTTAKRKSTNAMLGSTSSTSTPYTQRQLLRSMQRHTTPQLNGSFLSSCVSPSEKTGDNSDIFTVSSDGLDTDLDLSNSHTTQLMRNKSGDERDYMNINHHRHHPTTPKRKFNLAKYATNKNAAAAMIATSNTTTPRKCLAKGESATAAVKSIAISQFLTKEVKVTCRRLRAPFRRYRYRR